MLRAPAFRFLLALLAGLALAVSARADQAGTSYVIVPALGPGELVQAALVAGSHLDRSARAPLPGIGAAFDDEIVAMVEKAVRKRDPNAANVQRARISEGLLFQENTPSDDQASIDALREALGAPSEPSRRVMAVVIAPFRTDVRLRGWNSTFGNSKAKGLGFYVDHATPMKVHETGQRDRGFLGVFANMRLLLVDVGANRIVAEQTGAEGTTRAAARADGANPWDAVPNDVKLALLRGITLREVARMLPPLLASEP